MVTVLEDVENVLCDNGTCVIQKNITTVGSEPEGVHILWEYLSSVLGIIIPNIVIPCLTNIDMLTLAYRPALLCYCDTDPAECSLSRFSSLARKSESLQHQPPTVETNNPINLPQSSLPYD